MKILFCFDDCPYPFTIRSLKDTALGGTESSLLRAAHGLAARGHEVYISEQHFARAEDIEGVHYLPSKMALSLNQLDHAVLLQYAYSIPGFIQQYKGARKFLWLHNIPSRNLHQYKRQMFQAEMDVIGVSDFHVERIQRRLEGGWWQRLAAPFTNSKPLPVHRIYNSIAPNFVPMLAKWDPNQLISMSAPYKRLDLTINMFERVKRALPDLRLLIARPWESKVNELLSKDIHFLGALPQSELQRHVAESLCVFYPQWGRVETFGLVYAEANAIGTPFLAHDFGAAREVLSDPCQLVNGKDEQELVRKISEWQKERPRVWLKDEFKIEQVIGSWEKLLVS